MKYIIIIFLLLMVIPVHGYHINNISVTETNISYTKTILAPDGMVNISDIIFIKNENDTRFDTKNIWSIGKIRSHDKYISFIGEKLNLLKSYSPILKVPFSNDPWGMREIKSNLQNDALLIKNANNSYKDYVNYLKRFKTYYGCNETLLYGDVNTGELIEVREGGYGFVYSGSIPKREGMIVIHTHPDIFFWMNGIHDPIFSYGDISGFATDYKSGVKYEGVISSNAVAITNINSAENIDKNRRYSEYNIIDDFFGRFDQKESFGKIGMNLTITEWMDGNTINMHQIT